MFKNSWLISQIGSKNEVNFEKAYDLLNGALNIRQLKSKDIYE